MLLVKTEFRFQSIDRAIGIFAPMEVQELPALFGQQDIFQLIPNRDYGSARIMNVQTLSIDYINAIVLFVE